MGNARWDTYEPEAMTHGKYIEAWKRKKELVRQGWRVKIRKDATGAYTVFKKHDELFHGKSWREMNG